MTVLTSQASARSFTPLYIALGLYATAFGLFSGHQKLSLVALVAATAAAFVAATPKVAWRSMHVALLLVIFFIPIGRYTFAVNLPFDLEPYRLVVGIFLILWTASLLVDRRVKLRATGFELPMIAVVLATFASDALNPHTVALVQSNVLKSLLFFASFVLFYYFAVSTIRTWEDIDFVLKWLVGGAAALGLLGLIEYRTGSTPFNSFSRFVPILRYQPLPMDVNRGGQIRAIASAEHPIAFGALMVMVLPLSIYLVRKYGRRWLVASAFIALGAFGAVSRTPVTMLAGAALTIVWLRPYAFKVDMKRVALGIAASAVIIKLAAPGAVGAIRYQFDPQGGLIASQQTSKGSVVSGGRLTDIGPVLGDVAKEPFFGAGFGTRVVGVQSNGIFSLSGRILDDQWLGNLNDTGLIGLGAWTWLFWRFLRRLRRTARATRGDEGWLVVGLASSLVSYVVGMATWDAFGFTQETFIVYFIFALSALVIRPTRLQQRPVLALSEGAT